MANVILYTELLEDEELDERERRKFVRQASFQAKKMKWLLESMLKASQLEKGSISFSPEYTGIRETIGRSVSGVYAQAEDKRITILVEPFEDRRLYHDPKWTAEAMGNILDNAVKYSPEGSQIFVRVIPMEIYTQIEIKDQGIGIRREEYNQIFRRFYRGSQAAQQSEAQTADGEQSREEVTLSAFIQQSVTGESGIWQGWGAQKLHDDLNMKINFDPTGNEVESKLSQYLVA